MKRVELKGYDPFPTNVNTKRVVDDFEFSLEKFDPNLSKNYYSIRRGIDYFFCIKDLKTNIKKESRLYQYDVGHIDHTQDPLKFFEFINSIRKKYNIKNILIAFQEIDPNLLENVTDWQKQHITEIYPLDANRLNGYSMYFYHPELEYNKRLAATLKKDRKQWMAERRKFKKEKGIKNLSEYKSEEYDVVKTQNIMTMMPYVKQLREAADAVLEKGTNYKKSDIDNVNDAIFKLKHNNALKKLKKHGKK